MTYIARLEGPGSPPTALDSNARCMAPDVTMNGQVSRMNGEHMSNGATTSTTGTDRATKSPLKLPNGATPSYRQPTPSTNGATATSTQVVPYPSSVNGYDDAPSDILDAVSSDSYLPLARLIHRSAQRCWEGLLQVVEDMSRISVPPVGHDTTRPSTSFQFNSVNNQTKANLDKKDRWLEFASDQKADFVKLLVLLQWSKDMEGVRKTIAINFWLNQQRAAFYQTIQAMASISRDSVGFQIPNPDLEKAAEFLMSPEISESIAPSEFVVQEALTPRKMLGTMDALDQLLSIRLSLHENIPEQLQDFRIHDGRATFSVPNEFEIDVLVTDTASDSQFWLVDFRFSFSPTPAVPDDLWAQVEAIANASLQSGGLLECYNFFHDLTLSYKLSELHKQALELVRSQWSGHINVELLRRTLVIQYWPNKITPKSWVEIGIASGRSQNQRSNQPAAPRLHVRWFCENKEDRECELHIEEAALSVEALLRQVIAQHTNHIFDALYDKLATIPIFTNFDLLLEQRSSLDDPSDCFVDLELSKRKHVRLQIEPITGAVFLNPATEDSDRAQHQINRVRNIADDIIPKIVALRSQTSASEILGHMVAAGWETCQNFNFGQNEAKAIYGSNVMKLNVFRQSSWEDGHFLSLTTAADGDHWWLSSEPTAAKSSSHLFRLQKISCEPVHLVKNLSAEYFERLADYVSGVIVLQSNARELAELKLRSTTSEVPNFEQGRAFPPLSFDLQNANTQSHTDDTAMLRSSLPQVTDKFPFIGNTVALRYKGVDAHARQAVLVATTQALASADVLKKLISSDLGSGVNMSPESGRIEIHLQAKIGIPIIVELIEQLSHLATIIACTDIALRQLSPTIASMSSDTMTIQYRNTQQTSDLDLLLRFASRDNRARLELLPEDSNPHLPMLPHLNRRLQSSKCSLASALDSILPLLTTTYPLVSYLQKLQQPSRTDKSSQLRVHVLCRQPKLFAIQYFSSSAQGKRDTEDAETHPHLLARFEILPRTRGRRNFWLVRPAIEEFRSYTRPSYNAKALRDSVKQEVFSKRDVGKGWMPMDGGAVCSTEKPERLLDAIHDTVVAWTKEAEAVPVAPKLEKVKIEESKPQPQHHQPPPKAPQPNANGNQAARPPVKRQPSGTVQNGLTPQQRKAQMAKMNPMKVDQKDGVKRNNNNSNNKSNDVITID